MVFPVSSACSTCGTMYVDCVSGIRTLVQNSLWHAFSMCSNVTRVSNFETRIINWVLGFVYPSPASDIWNTFNQGFLMACYMVIVVLKLLVYI